MSAVAIVVTTLPSCEAARDMAALLVEERLAACVQLAAVTSLYRWQGTVERADETRLEAKTAADRVPALTARIAALHPYAVPEIVVLPADGSASYHAWVAAETRPA